MGQQTGKAARPLGPHGEGRGKVHREGAGRTRAAAGATSWAQSPFCLHPRPDPTLLISFLRLGAHL